MFNGLFSRIKGDPIIWSVVLLLSFISLLVIYSSTEAIAYRKHGGDTGYYVVKQAGFLIAGLIIMYVCHLFNYMLYARFAPIALVASIILLFVTLFMGSINQARRWLHFGDSSISFQTSDMAKLGLILFVALGLSKMQAQGEKNAVGNFWSIFLPILIVCGLIAPANLSTAALLFFTCICLMFVGRVDLKAMGNVLLAGAGLFAVLILIGDAAPRVVRVSTWISRIRNFLLPDETLSSGMTLSQVNQAKMAIAKGGLFGVGPGNGTMANNLTHAYSDYAYSVVIEEYGLLLGGAGLLFLYLTLMYRCVIMVTKSPKAFGALLAFGLSLLLVTQALAHMAVNVNLMPVTGLPLPLISLGGTSLLFSSVSLGIILSVSRYIEVSQQ